MLQQTIFHVVILLIVLFTSVQCTDTEQEVSSKVVQGKSSGVKVNFYPYKKIKICVKASKVRRRCETYRRRQCASDERDKQKSQ